MKKPVFISVVTYLYNSSGVVVDYINRVIPELSEHFVDYELILINDASTDDTEQVIREQLSAKDIKIRLISMAWKHGQELAMLAGSDAAIGDFVFEVDYLDTGYPSGIFVELYEKSVTGFDIVAAVPKSEVRFSSKMFYSLINSLSSIKLNLDTEMLRIVSRRALNASMKSREKIRYRKGLYKLTGFPTTTIDYKTTNKINQNKTVWENFNLAFDILISFSELGLKATFALSILFFLFSLGGGLYALGLYLFRGNLVEGWTTLMLFSAFGFSGIFFIFGLMTKYLSIILTEVRQRDSYKVSFNELLTNLLD